MSDSNPEAALLAQLESAYGHASELAPYVIDSFIGDSIAAIKKLRTEGDRDYEGMRRFQGRAIAAESNLRDLRQLVDRQAEDEGLWFVATTAPEAYLQQELRKLHAAIEGSAPDTAEGGSDG